MFRVVEGGCRFGEIDAVLRNVRFFFLGIPFKSQQSFTLPKIWGNVNMELQYNFLGCSSLACRAVVSREGGSIPPIYDPLAKTFGV